MAQEAHYYLAISPNSDAKLSTWRSQCNKLSIKQQQKLAAELVGRELYFDWEAPRSREGYYRIKGGVDYCVHRAIAFSPYADLIWMEVSHSDNNNNNNNNYYHYYYYYHFNHYSSL